MLAELFGTLVAFVAVLGKCAKNHLIETGADGWVVVRRRGNCFAHVLVCNRYRGLALERRATGEHFIEQHAS